MKSLIESLFDKDLAKKDPPMNIQYVVDTVRKHIEKEFGVKCLSEKEFKSKSKTNHTYEGLFGYYDDTFVDGELDMEHITLYKLFPVAPTTYNNESGIGPGVSICISNEGDEVALSRIDVGTIHDFGRTWPSPQWACVWDGDEYKLRTKLKTPFFNSKSIKSILDYIDKVCKKVFDYDPTKDKWLKSMNIDKNEFYF